MNKPAISIADIDTTTMTRQDHLLDALAIGILVKQSRDELPRGLKTALVNDAAALLEEYASAIRKDKVDDSKVWRALETRSYKPTYQMIISGS